MNNQLSVILNNLVGVLGGAIGPITAVTYVAGIIFLGVGLMGLKRVGEDRGAPKPFAAIVIGVIFLSIGTFIATVSETIFGSGTKDLLSQVPSGSGVLDGYIRFAVTLVVVVGFYSVIKGLVKLKQASEGKANDSWSGFTHIGGGIICCNIVTFSKMFGMAAGGVVQELVTKLFG